MNRFLKFAAAAAVLADGAARTATVLFGAGVLAVLFWPPAERAIGAVFQ